MVEIAVVLVILVVLLAYRSRKRNGGKYKLEPIVL